MEAKTILLGSACHYFSRHGTSSKQGPQNNTSASPPELMPAEKREKLEAPHAGKRLLRDNEKEEVYRLYKEAVDDWALPKPYGDKKVLEKLLKTVEYELSIAEGGESGKKQRLKRINLDVKALFV